MLLYYIAMELKELRKSSGLTQPEAAALLNIPFRTYCRYEDEKKYEGSFKYNQFMSILSDYAAETVLSVDAIKNVLKLVFDRYKVDSCYLFGSYAKNKATPKSDIDLMIVTSVDGIEFYELIGELEAKLHKKVDLLKLETAVQNVKLMNEILKDGIKIYG